MVRRRNHLIEKHSDRRAKRLCRRAKRAERNAASELLQMYYTDIYAYLRRLSRCDQDAEDLTQQTFLKVWSSLDSFRGRGTFSAWLYRIAHNTHVDWRRRNRGQASYRPDPWWHEREDENPSPPALVAERQLAHKLYETVDGLDEDRRQIVHLHYYQGLSIRETAKVLGVATSTVKYRLREVLKVLRTAIDVGNSQLKPEGTLLIPKGELT